jgi:hypothetical protein
MQYDVVFEYNISYYNLLKEAGMIGENSSKKLDKMIN